MEQFIKYVGLDVHGKTIAAAVADSRSSLLFAGNITRQPYFEGRNYRIATSLERSDKVMNHTFWIGVFPALNTEMLDYTAQKISEFMGRGFRQIS